MCSTGLVAACPSVSVPAVPLRLALIPPTSLHKPLHGALARLGGNTLVIGEGEVLGEGHGEGTEPALGDSWS